MEGDSIIFEEDILEVNSEEAKFLIAELNNARGNVCFVNRENRELMLYVYGKKKLEKIIVKDSEDVIEITKKYDVEFYTLKRIMAEIIEMNNILCRKLCNDIWTPARSIGYMIIDLNNILGKLIQLSSKPPGNF